MSVVAIGSIVYIILAFLLSFLIVEIGSGMSGASYWASFFQLFPRYLVMMIHVCLIGGIAQWNYVAKKKHLKEGNVSNMPSGRKLFMVALTVVALVLLNNALISLYGKLMR